MAFNGSFAFRSACLAIALASPAASASVVQQAYLKASNTGLGDAFGRTIAVSGDTLVVGANWEDGSATGVDGDGTNDDFHNAGAVYVYVRNGATWSQQAYLKASNTGADDEFGRSVAISGDTIVVGAPLEDSSASGVDGNQANNGAGGSGATYVFVRSGTVWTQQAYLKASNPEMNDDFGRSVSVWGDTIVVGAEFEDSSATGVDGNQTDNGATNSGAAYVFVRNGTTWSQQAYLKASNTQTQDSFGVHVSVSGDTAVVGAYLEDNNAGAAYVFVRNGATWSQQAYLKASNGEAGDQFGISVAVSGNSIVVGASGERSNATGVNGNQTDDSLLAAGAAYVFVRSGATWSQQAYLKASNPAALSQFGWPVSISGDTIVAGAHQEDSGSTGVGGDPTNTNASASGAAYLFARNGATWSPRAYIKASNTDANDHFGTSAAVSGDLAVVGAPDEDSLGTGVNGDQGNGSSNTGAAYVFDLDVLFGGFCFPGTAGAASCPCGQPANASGGCANFGASATTGAVLGARGTASLSADTIVLETTNHRTAPPAGILNVFFTGQGTLTAGTASNAGLRCVNGTLRRLYSGNTVAGMLSKPGMGEAGISARSSSLGVPITAGETRHYFNIYRDSSAGSPCGNPLAGTNLTNAGSISWTP